MSGPEVLGYREAWALLLRERLCLDYTPENVDLDYDAGGDYQLGEYTWGHDNASITATWKDPDNKKRSFFVDFEFYNVPPYGGWDNVADQPIHSKSEGFAGLLEDLMYLSAKHARGEIE